jgi:type I restriction enzyme S subunit
MGGDFSFTPLGSLVDETRGISYGVVQPGQHVDDGVPIVRVTDIRHGRINQVDPLRVAPEIADKYRRTVLRGGELLLTLVGTVGETAVVPASLAGWNTARAVAVLPVLDEPGPRWVQYALQTGPAREYIQTRLNTTVQATLNLGDVTTLPIPLPPRGARRRILSILGTLDDKIELNRKMNATAESMARALFKSWFVDFDPVRARAEGRAPSGMDAETAKLFPCEFVESELGTIPKSWRATTWAPRSNGVVAQSKPVPSGASCTHPTTSRRGCPSSCRRTLAGAGFRRPASRAFVKSTPRDCRDIACSLAMSSTAAVVMSSAMP